MLLVLAVSSFGINACNTSTSTSQGTDTTASNVYPIDSMSMDSNNMMDTGMKPIGFMSAMEPSMRKMQSIQMTGDFDQDFANMMIEHHQGAIDMARVELVKGKNKKMMAMAQSILSKQTAEQKQFREILKSFKPSGMKHGEGVLQKSMTGMSKAMKSIPMSGNIDKDFAAMMIPHHEAAVSMFKMEQENGMNIKLKDMAQKGIKDQQREIAEFKAWLSANSK
jgi:uncharacterized protein (DUF305 family)